jgi:His-Xaa-Ser system protein HxsD
MRVEVPATGFSLEAAKRAAYDMMAVADVSFQLVGDILCCDLSPIASESDASSLERDFRRNLLDHELRLSVEQRTDPLRAAILGIAFSKTGLQRE